MLEVRGVSKSWNEISALVDVRFRTEDATYAVLVGASGSGKSTLLRAIAGLIEIDAGQIILNGVDLTVIPPHQRPVTTVFQDYALFPHMTVAANIAFGLEQQDRPARDIRQRVGEMMELVGLVGMERRMPPSLSGGQQQRVALARALAVQPQLVLLDEPLGALDSELRGAMRRELRRIQRESRVTFLHVSHDREEALSLADQLLIMHAGRLIGDGSSADLRDAPGNARVARVVGLENVIPDPDRRGSMLAFAPEHVTIGHGRWRGRVVDVRVIGAMTECEIAMQDGLLIRQRSFTGGSLKIGDEVLWEVAAESTRSISAE